MAQGVVRVFYLKIFARRDLVAVFLALFVFDGFGLDRPAIRFGFATGFHERIAAVATLDAGRDFPTVAARPRANLLIRNQITDIMRGQLIKLRATPTALQLLPHVILINITLPK